MIVMLDFQDDVRRIVETSKVFAHQHHVTWVSEKQAIELIHAMVDDVLSQLMEWAPVGANYEIKARECLPWYHPEGGDTLSDSFWSRVMDQTYIHISQGVKAVYPGKTWDVVAVATLPDNTIVLESMGDWRAIQYEMLVEQDRILPEGWKCRHVHGNPIIIPALPDMELRIEVGTRSENDCELPVTTDGYTT